MIGPMEYFLLFGDELTKRRRFPVFAQRFLMRADILQSIFFKAKKRTKYV